MCWSHLNPLCLKDGQKEFYEEFKFHSCSLRLYAKSSRQMSVLTLSLNKQIIESQFFWLLFSKRTIGCCYNFTMNADWNTHSQHRHAYSYTVPEPTDRSSFSQCMQEALTLYIIHFKLSVQKHCHSCRDDSVAGECQPLARCTVSCTDTELCISVPPSSVQSLTDGNLADLGPYCPERIPHGHMCHTYSEKQQCHYVGPLVETKWNRIILRSHIGRICIHLRNTGNSDVIFSHGHSQIRRVAMK